MVTTDADLFKINTKKILLQQKCKLRIHGRGCEVVGARTGSSLQDKRRILGGPVGKSKRMGPTKLQHREGSPGARLFQPRAGGEIKAWGRERVLICVGTGTQAKRFLHHNKPHFYLNILSFFLSKRIKGLSLLTIAFRPIWGGRGLPSWPPESGCFLPTHPARHLMASGEKPGPCRGPGGAALGPTRPEAQPPLGSCFLPPYEPEGPEGPAPGLKKARSL